MFEFPFEWVGTKVQFALLYVVILDIFEGVFEIMWSIQDSLVLFQKKVGIGLCIVIVFSIIMPWNNFLITIFLV